MIGMLAAIAGTIPATDPPIILFGWYDTYEYLKGDPIPGIDPLLANEFITDSSELFDERQPITSGPLVIGSNGTPHPNLITAAYHNWVRFRFKLDGGTRQRIMSKQGDPWGGAWPGTWLANVSDDYFDLTLDAVGFEWEDKPRYLSFANTFQEMGLTYGANFFTFELHSPQTTPEPSALLLALLSLPILQRRRLRQ